MLLFYGNGIISAVGFGIFSLLMKIFVACLELILLLFYYKGDLFLRLCYLGVDDAEELS